MPLPSPRGDKKTGSLAATYIHDENFERPPFERASKANDLTRCSGGLSLQNENAVEGIFVTLSTPNIGITRCPHDIWPSILGCAGTMMSSSRIMMH
jgi:hypothetical protein